MGTRADDVRAAYPLFQAGSGGAIPTSALDLRVVKVVFADALAMNRLWHSRLPRMGTGFIKRQPFLCYAAEFDGIYYAAAIWSNPVARKLPQQEWLELRRLAIAPDAPRNTASRLMSVMARLIRKERPEVTTLVSYHDTEVHTGSIYRAAGWVATVRSGGGGWSCPSRPHPKVQSDAPKQRWEKSLIS